MVNFNLRALSAALLLVSASASASSPLVRLPHGGMHEPSTQVQLGVAALMGLAACNAKAALMPQFFGEVGANYLSPSAVLPAPFQRLAQANRPVLLGSFMEEPRSSSYHALSKLSELLELLPGIGVIAVEQHVILGSATSVAEIAWTLNGPAEQAFARLATAYQIKSDSGFYAAGNQLRCRAVLAVVSE